MLMQLTARISPKLLGLTLLFALSTIVSCAQEIDLPGAAPWADAGDDQWRQWNGQDLVIGLDGRASCDPLGEAVKIYDWRIFSQPEEADIHLQRADSVHPSFLAKYPGQYILTLEVLSGERWSDPDPVNIHISDTIAEDYAPSVPLQDRCGNDLSH